MYHSEFQLLIGISLTAMVAIAVVVLSFAMVFQLLIGISLMVRWFFSQSNLVKSQLLIGISLICKALKATGNDVKMSQLLIGISLTTDFITSFF